MSYTTTPNLGLLKPTVGGDDDAWGGHINQNADTLDTQTATKTYTDARRRRFIAALTANYPNVGASTTEEVATVWTVPAGLLANVGDVIHCVVKLQVATTTDTKQFRLRWTTLSNGTGGLSAGFATANAAATANVFVESWIMKTAANAQKYWYSAVQASNLIGVADGTTAYTDANVLYLALTLQNSTAAAPGSLTLTAAFAEYLPGL